MLIKPKGSPFYIFRHYATFCERKNFKRFKFFSKKVFCAFRALDIAPTLNVPVLFEVFIEIKEFSRPKGTFSTLSMNIMKVSNSCFQLEYFPLEVRGMTLAASAKVIETMPMTTFHTFVSNIGGLMGMCLGLSAISLVKLVKKMLKMTTKLTSHFSNHH